MAVIARSTWAFHNHFEGYGWTETLWNVNAADLTQAVKQAEKYAELRVQMLGAEVTLTEIRCSDDELIRDSLLGTPPTFSLDPANSFRYYNVFLKGQNPVAIDTSLNVRLECGSKHRGPIFLGGMPFTTIANFLANDILDPTVQKAFDAWSVYVAGKPNGNAGTFGIKVLNSKGEGPALTPVTGVVQNLSQWTITSVAHGLQTGDRVRINGLQMLAGRISWSNTPIIRLTADTFQVSKTPKNPVGLYTGGGNVQKMVPFVAACTSATPATVTHRKRGRVFGQRRGRGRK